MVTKEQMQTELKDFLSSYLESVGRVYGNAVALPDVADASATTLWHALDSMYDYGVAGQQLEGGWNLGDGELLDARFSDAEMFLRGLDSMQTFLDEDNCQLPAQCLRVARTAVARHVLEGGSRDTDFDGLPPMGFLTIAEVALLADMDERSVRNAANPQKEGHLVTTSADKRTLVAVEEARRWLAGRKSFTPTGGVQARSTQALSPSLVAALERQAAAAGLTPDEFVQQRLLAAGEAA